MEMMIANGSYYQFGNKLEAERQDYDRLVKLGNP